MDSEDEYIALGNELDRLTDRKSKIEGLIRDIKARREHLKADVINDFTEHGVDPNDHSIVEVKPKPVVTDESLLPEEFIKIERKVDKKKINEAIKGGRQIEGVTFDNGGYTLRRK